MSGKFNLFLGVLIKSPYVTGPFFGKGFLLAFKDRYYIKNIYFYNIFLWN